MVSPEHALSTRPTWIFGFSTKHQQNSSDRISAYLLFGLCGSGIKAKSSGWTWINKSAVRITKSTAPRITVKGVRGINQRSCDKNNQFSTVTNQNTNQSLAGLTINLTFILIQKTSQAFLHAPWYFSMCRCLLTKASERRQKDRRRTGQVHRRKLRMDRWLWRMDQLSEKQLRILRKKKKQQTPQKT